MKRLAIVLFLLLSAVWGFAQEPLSGIVVDDTGKALAGANVVQMGRCSALPSPERTEPFS